MLNKWVGMGRLVHSPELRNTQSGKNVASFSIACERDYKDQSGERGTDYIDVVAWGNTAIFVNKYLAKGRMVVVEGRWQMRDYTDRNGNKRRAWEVLASSVYFADSPKKADGGDAPAGPAAPAPGGFTEIENDDGELPF
ncbi:MAG: single-stranded DNA-binding protein [Clostridiales bacterium]|nr:single-stranded DNA-binding protein [Clostridiales bacterium]MDY4181010.1 single-stranded DNA-binding protein [Pseudoflavonifractor sp.]